MSWDDWACTILGALCLLLIVLPPRWDPAIRLKEWAEKKREER